jgi:hypothetical protein
VTVVFCCLVTKFYSTFEPLLNRTLGIVIELTVIGYSCRSFKGRTGVCTGSCVVESLRLKCRELDDCCCFLMLRDYLLWPKNSMILNSSRELGSFSLSSSSAMCSLLKPMKDACRVVLLAAEKF